MGVEGEGEEEEEEEMREGGFVVEGGDEGVGMMLFR